ncbi:MAG: cysteine hydrolase [Firmicutes bacterium]|nr:cysteine hydrolase [Bacillota bacterium]
MNTALVLIDIQNEYFPGGRRVLHEPEACAARAAEALQWFRGKGWTVVYIQHISREADAAAFRPGTAGIAIHESIRPLPGEAVIVKCLPDGFMQTRLHETLQALSASRLVICGMMSHMCVDTTVRAAKPLGYEVLLLGDACATRDLSWKGQSIGAATVHAAFMAALSGSFATVIDTAALPEAL